MLTGAARLPWLTVIRPFCGGRLTLAMKDSDRTWPWFQQTLDAVAAMLGIGLAISMGYRNSYPLTGVVLVAACIGKLTASQLLRFLMGRWDAKP